MREKINKIMHILVHNSFLVTVIVIGLVHAALLGITWYADVTPLANFNILSVVVSSFCVGLCKNGHYLPVYVSLFLEVVIYSAISVYYIGWGCGSYFFLFSIVPIVIYFGCFFLKGSNRRIIVLMLILIFTMFVVLYVIYGKQTPKYSVNDTIREILFTFSAFAMFFAVVFYNAIYIYSSEDEKSSLEEKNVRLSADALEDTLTGLLNRRGFLPKVDELIKVDGAHFCIAFFDIDNFKRINDSYGHDCGDEVLRHISSMVKKEMHGCEICRWGGEEFIILMKDYDMAVAGQKMEYIRKLIESTPTVFYNKHISVTVTIGLEEYSDKYPNPEDIIKVADERMYYGKQHGKNIVISEDVKIDK
ncbi:MAG: GGDEF domain-containing protein [Lachnospiraceae bacterium]|nr:GGDEF domain-containing protein [Lachnospiraceae bacterium]